MTYFGSHLIAMFIQEDIQDETVPDGRSKLSQSPGGAFRIGAPRLKDFKFTFKNMRTSMVNAFVEKRN